MHMVKQHKENKISKRRSITLVGLVIVVFSIYACRLFQIQIVEGEEYAEMAKNNYGTNISIAASRGELLDRYLRPIAMNRTSLQIIFDYNFFPSGDSEEKHKEQAAIILSLTDLLTKSKEPWNDTLPISKTAPYSFEKDQEKAIAKLKSTHRLSDYATAEQCMNALVETYHLQELSPENQRIVAGVQYEMGLRGFAVKNPFVFSNDISKETSYIIQENNAFYQGVDVQPTAVREYVDGTLAPHLIGTIGPIYAEEYADLKEKGYQMNDLLGKSGFESAFESYLRGTTGTRTLIKDASGKVIDEYEKKSPVPGNSVVLTLDSQLQSATQKALEKKFNELRKLPSGSYNGKFNMNGHDVRSGSAVVLDIKTGGVLACASWPGYDLTTYNQDYDKLIKHKDNPLFNRALNGAFPVGSTMKPGMALAAMSEGIYNSSSHIATCTGKYQRFAKYNDRPGCLGRHGSIDVVEALRVSCNVFFYETGYLLGIDRMNEYSTQFGLGQKTGVEIGESTGVLAGPAHRLATGGQWMAGDTIRAAIGQSDNAFTPIQLAAYAMTIANDGVRYKTHFLQSVRSYNGVTENTYTPEVVARMKLSKDALKAVEEGMVACVKAGTARYAFRGVKYTAAGKTGTAQTGYNNRTDHGTFIGYAPVDKPEVAISVVMESGTSPAASEVARAILDAYFKGKENGASPTPEGVLLP